jgi:glycosyltransferase involved in cell wall biosynthesis
MKELQIENKSVKKKVAIIGLKGLPAFGGAATVGENLIENLKDKYNFYVYSIETHTKRFAENDGFIQIVFNQFPIKKLNIFIYYCKSAVHCLKNNYDLIHLHHIDGAFIIPILKLKYKIITTSHAQTYLSEKWPAYIKLFFRINERIMLKFSDKVTAVSLQLTNYYESNSSREIFYIPNGINPNIKVDHSPLERNRYLLFAAGRIIPLKGLHTLMSAMKILGNQEDLLVIGDLGQMPAYKQKILEMAKDIEVTFMGLIKNKSVLLNYVRHCILFIFPSYI